MKDLLNCPNCGAPIQNDICPYCGSVFLDWATFDVRKPTFVKIKDHWGNIRLLKLGTGSIQINQEVGEDSVCYMDNRPYVLRRGLPQVTIEAEFYVEPFFYKKLNQTVMSILIRPEKVTDHEAVKEILEEL